MDERALVDAISLVLRGDEPSVKVGVGDDAAVVEHTSGDLVLAADMLVEGVDFLLDRESARDIGAKAAAVNLSDIAAMGAAPRYALVSLGLSPKVDVAWVVDLFGGMRDVTEDAACSIVGGDLSAASEVVVSVAVTGAVAPGSAVTRVGARPGDALVVTGPLGAAAGGLALTRSSQATRLVTTSEGRGLLEALTRPVARVAEGRFLASHGATAMIDLSDGLARDLHRLCRASGVGATVRREALPVDPRLTILDVPPMDLALFGGEDFALLATIPAQEIDAACAAFEEMFLVPLTVIGSISEGFLVQVQDDGDLAALPDEGFDHFG